MSAPSDQPVPSAPGTAEPRFCPNCGVALGGTVCRACGAPLSAGVRFCHRCGTAAAGTPVPLARSAKGRAAEAVPWVVAAVALLAVVALAAGQRFGRAPSSDVSQAGMPGGIIVAPDISSLTPSQRAERLYDRVMSAAERGRDDSVRFFMPMAIGAYEALGTLTADQRYDLGRLGDVAGDARLAAAQADTILRDNPRHLLGLILASRAAQLRGDSVASRRLLQQLTRAERAERQRQLPEYLVHQNDIDAALAEAREPAR